MAHIWSISVPQSRFGKGRAMNGVGSGGIGLTPAEAGIIEPIRAFFLAAIEVSVKESVFASGRHMKVQPVFARALDKG